MREKTIVGIDNGVTGSLGFAYPDGSLEWEPMPIVRVLNYTKKVAWVNIIDVARFEALLDKPNLFCFVERPMINPMRFKSSVSAIRAFETTQQTLIRLKIPYHFIDSKEWQRQMLPKGTAKVDLKLASDEICRRYLPAKSFKKGNGDGLLIAIYGKILESI